MRKKVLLSIITLSSALALSGCGNKTETPEVTSVVEAVSLEPLTEPATQTPEPAPTQAATEPATQAPSEPVTEAPTETESSSQNSSPEESESGNN